jgi:hypothetical protein
MQVSQMTARILVSVNGKEQEDYAYRSGLHHEGEKFESIMKHRDIA